MAISFDAVSNAGTPGNVSSFTFAHVIGAGANQALIVTAVGNTGNNDFTISGITYNGVSLANVRNRPQRVRNDPGRQWRALVSFRRT